MAERSDSAAAHTYVRAEDAVHAVELDVQRRHGEPTASKTISTIRALLLCAGLDIYYTGLVLERIAQQLVHNDSCLTIEPDRVEVTKQIKLNG
jgi:hypothetical protein